MNKETIREIRDKLDELLEECEDEEWPYDEMIIPTNPENMNEEDWENAPKMKYTPPYGLRFRMPSKENNFPCHDCGGEYGPWIHKKMFHHGVFDRSIGEVKIRRCRDCGHIHHASYSIGKYTLEEREDSTSLKIKR